MLVNDRFFIEIRSYSWNFGNFGGSILNPEFAINEYAVPGIAKTEGIG